MLNLVTEQEILDYLMTSDYNEGLTSEEYRFLLLRFRYYYRLNHSTAQSLKYRVDDLLKDTLDKDEEYQKLKNEIDKLHRILDSEKNRKLTWKERWKGKKDV